MPGARAPTSPWTCQATPRPLTLARPGWLAPGRRPADSSALERPGGDLEQRALILLWGRPGLVPSAPAPSPPICSPPPERRPPSGYQRRAALPSPSTLTVATVLIPGPRTCPCPRPAVSSEPQVQGPRTPPSRVNQGERLSAARDTRAQRGDRPGGRRLWELLGESGPPARRGRGGPECCRPPPRTPTSPLTSPPGQEPEPPCVPAGSGVRGQG